MPNDIAAKSDHVDLTVYVPCYNEEKLILKTLDTIRQAASGFSFKYEVLVFDDGSKDRSADLVREYIQKNHLEGQFELVSEGKNRGVGANYFRAAERGRGTYFIVFFGDNSEPVESMIKMFDLMGKADVIIPYIDSRFRDTKFNSDHRGFLRRATSITYASFVRFLSGHRLHYFNGFVMHRRENVLKNRVPASGLGYQSEMLCKVLEDPNVTFLEVRVSCWSRESGMPTAFRLKNVISVAGSLWRIFSNHWFSPAR
ncbi:MAG: hypothetical protein A2X46_18515 [Lentisphaerae bacterium GWF2_57_35]|nr:MAG: hypothetical protein A2X46_18515 [Lentisphaerae bacterium GWF2_57_35]